MTKLEGMTKSILFGFSVIPRLSLAIPSSFGFVIRFVDCFVIQHSPARTFGFRHSVAKEPLRFQEKLESLQAACDTESRR
jgi:hypothetical protein